MIIAIIPTLISILFELLTDRQWTLVKVDFAGGITSVTTTTLLGWIEGILRINFMMAIAYTFLNIIRNVQRDIKPLEDVFRTFDRKMFLSVVLLYVVESIFIMLWTLLLIIPGIIKSYSYSQSFYILYDRLRSNPDEMPNVLDCITESRHLMNGHKFDLFVLHLSFILWHLLGLITLGIAYLWVTPYIIMSESVFYENISRQAYLNEFYQDDFLEF